MSVATNGSANTLGRPSQSRTPLERIRLGAFVLVAIFTVAVLGYRFLTSRGWVESIWMAVITVSSVGYGERSQADAFEQLFSIAVIVLGMSAAVYTVGGLIQMMLEGEIDRALGQSRISRGIDHLHDHVIICGFGRIGQLLADDLHRQQRPFVVIDQDLQQFEDAKASGYLCLHGDATDDAVLIAAGMKRASTLVTGLPSDAANVFITLTARNLNSTIQIIARAEHDTTESKLRQAGANKIVKPAITGARQMGRMITRPSTADLMELVAESTFRDLELDEVNLRNGSKLTGVTVEETEAQRRHKLLVVAVNDSDGKMIFNPDGDYKFRAGDIVIVMGNAEDIERFRTEYEV